ncbi:hypothetical protein IWQ57_002892, partial [Coemansia nantahalensis]
CSYYTLIWSFSGYIAQVLGRNINIRSGYGSNGPNEDPNFIMKPVAYNTSGLVTLSGNLFNARDVHDDLPPVYEDARRDVAVHPAVSNQGFGGASFGSEKGGDMRKA